MKHSTQFFRGLTLMVAMLISTTFAYAETDDAYHWFFSTFEAYPSGAGKIYVEDQEVETPIASKDEVPVESWAANQEYKAEKFGSVSTYLNGFAQPAEGWQFIGWGTKDEVTIPASTDMDYDFLTINSKTSAEDNNVDLTPFEPDTTVYALFSHVTASVDESCNMFGTVSVKPLVNTIDDQVTLTAIPDATYEAKFEYWLAPDGETKLTDAELKVTVSEAANYTAFFSSDAVKTLPAPADGGVYQIVYFDRDATILDENAYALTLDLYELDLKADSIGYSESKFISGRTPTIVYSFGDIPYLPSTDEPPYIPENLIWSGDGLSVSELDGEQTYYQVVLPNPEDWTSELSLKRVADDATVPAAVMLVAIPNSTVQALNMAETLVIVADDELTAVKSVKAQPMLSAGKLYDLSGRRVEAMDRPGIYILDGKKIVFRK